MSPEDAADVELSAEEAADVALLAEDAALDAALDAEVAGAEVVALSVFELLQAARARATPTLRAAKVVRLRIGALLGMVGRVRDQAGGGAEVRRDCEVGEGGAAMNVSVMDRCAIRHRCQLEGGVRGRSRSPTMPPSTASVVPVVDDAAGEAR